MMDTKPTELQALRVIRDRATELVEGPTTELGPRMIALIEALDEDWTGK